MRFSFHTHVYKKLASARTLLGVSLLALSPALGWAQTTPAYITSQNFELANGGGKLRYTATGAGTTYSGLSGTDYLPNNNRRYVGTDSGPEGYSFGVQNSANGNNRVSTRVDFRNIQLTSTATLTFRVAVFAIPGNGNGNSTNGLGTNGSIIVGVNPDSAAAPDNYREVLSITGDGGNGTYWSFDNNTPPATAVSSFSGPIAYTATSQNAMHYTQVRVNLNTLSQAKIRITLTASARTLLLIDDVSVSSSTPLPVELVRFTAQAQEKNVALHWITASEKNSDYFEVQRSTNGATFNAIGKVQGEGTTSSISNYLFTDRTPVAGLAYYRLRQVDFDGTESYSPVQAVTWQGGAVASFYPNPSAESITFTGTDGRLHYRIYNANGQQVAVGDADSGSPVDLRGVPAGIYLLELNNKGQRSVQRFVRL